MVSQSSQDVIARGKRLYEQELRATLEVRCPDQYVAIEPDSGDYFVAPTFDAAVRLARDAHPEKVPYAMRVGHVAAFQIGVLRQ